MPSPIDEYDLISRIIQVLYNRYGKLQLLKDYYSGDQAQYLPPYTFETSMQFAERIRATRVENHVKPICEQIPARLYGTETGSHVISRRVDDDATNKWMHEHIYEDVDNQAALYDMCLESIIYGHSICEFVLWDKFDETPYDFRGPFDPKRMTVKLVVQDLQKTAPIQRPNNPSKLGAIIRYYRKDAVNPFYNLLSNPVQGIAGKEIDVAEYIDDDWHYFWEREPTGSDWWRIPHPLAMGTPVVFGQPMREWKNAFGKIRNRFAVLRAPGSSTDLEGYSMISQLIPLQDDINESRYDDMRITQLYQWPIGTFKGGTAPQNFQMGVDRYLEFGDPNITFEWVQPDMNLEASENRKAQDRMAMNQVAGISEISRGITENIGQARSSAAFYVLFSPDILNLKKRLPRIIQFEKTLIRGVASLWNVVTGKGDLNPEARIDISVPDDLMGRDILIEAEALQIQQQTGLLDLVELYKERYPNENMRQIMARIRRNEPPEDEPAGGNGGTSSGGRKQ